ncbi:DNA N-6-adenine-methyltransferase [Fusobacterium varium]|uniref:DNA N-6-adenine-methyltransferase n=1 Tax=Fusobacterium varium TaxID=856 RepID=UPI0022E9820B|nr:DNA N-6-adenine-methyltransferase [Fusobacterium varium]
MNTDLMFSSEKMDWTTPIDKFKEWDKEFNFTLDPCSTHENAVCEKHYTIKENGLLQDWGGETVYCNPPYGREIKHWVKKCYEESLKPNTTVVLLIFARTDTKYFHDYIYGKAELRFIKGRLKFGNCKNSAPFPSMIAIFRS